MSSALPSRLAPHRRVLVAAAAVSLFAGVGVGVLASRTVQAAVIEGAVQEITVSPTNPSPSDQILTTVDWCVPNGTQEGDTFTIELPEQLGGFPPSFPLSDPAGELVATATIGGNPVVATITMTDYAETHVGVCGDAFFESRLVADDVAETTQTLTYVVNGTVTFERTIDVSAAGGPVRTQGVKRGEFTDPDDQCRTSATDCIEWVLTTRVGPYDTVSFDDVSADGLSFNCGSLSLLYWTVNPDGTRGSSSSPAGAGASADIDCSATGVSVVTGPVPAGMLVRLRIPSTPDEPAPTGGALYSNAASITHSGADGTTTDSVSASSRSAAAGGSGVGVGVDIEKFDTDGNDADTAADSVNLPTGEIGLVFTITNTGTDALIDVVVSDVVIVGAATVSGLTCDFSTAGQGAPTSGTTWAGPFPPGAQFDCTATLSGVQPGAVHADRATVTGLGSASGEVVTDEDDYHANRSSSTTTTQPSGSTTTTQPGATTTSTVAQAAVTTTTVPGATTTIASRSPLPVTGSSVVLARLAFALLAVGGLLAGIAARRRPADQT